MIDTGKPRVSAHISRIKRARHSLMEFIAAEGRSHRLDDLSVEQAEARLMKINKLLGKYYVARTIADIRKTDFEDFTAL